jgi:hypothetical protein
MRLRFLASSLEDPFAVASAHSQSEYERSLLLVVVVTSNGSDVELPGAQALLDAFKPQPVELDTEESPASRALFQGAMSRVRRLSRRYAAAHAALVAGARCRAAQVREHPLQKSMTLGG